MGAEGNRLQELVAVRSQAGPLPESRPPALTQQELGVLGDGDEVQMSRSQHLLHNFGSNLSRELLGPSAVVREPQRGRPALPQGPPILTATACKFEIPGWTPRFR